MDDICAVLEKSANVWKRERDVFDSSILDANNIDKTKIDIKKITAMAYISMTFETDTTMIHVNKCKSADWLNGLAAKTFKGSGPNLQIWQLCQSQELS